MPTLIKLQYQPDSEPLFSRLRKLPYACWLDSGQSKSQRGRYDILTALPQTRLVNTVTHGSSTTTIYKLDTKTHQETQWAKHHGCPFEQLEQALADIKPSPFEQDLPFIGGALGYWGYELGSYYMGVPIPAAGTPKLPDMAVGIYHWAIVQDHLKQRSYLAYLDSCDESIIEQVQVQLNTPPPQTQPFTAQVISATETKTHYKRNVQRILEYIGAGDCYQANYAQRFTGSYTGDTYTAYQHLRKVMASPYCAYIDLGNDQAILSLSPERFIRVQNDEVLTQPIKGTTPRDNNPTIDQANAEELQASEKNRAENVMIVDLLRNDLGKHCQAGSIAAPELFTLKSYPNVHHLISNVVGTLKTSSTSLKLLKDSFPGGSITGAPKKRSMEIIQELEQKRRGIYCGSIGYINHNGDMDTNIAIRTVSCKHGQLECWGGGGIVADSEPQDEYQETLNKVGMLLKALGTESFKQ